MYKRLTVFLAVSLWLSCAALAQKKVLLKFNLVNGVQYEQTFDYNITQQMGNQQNLINMKAGFLVKVTGEEEGVKAMDFQYTRFGISLTGPTMSFAGDSQDSLPATFDPAKIVSYVFKFMVGQTFNAKVNAKGEVISFSGFEKMLDSLTHNLSEQLQLSQEQVQQFRQVAASQMNEASMKEMLQQSFNIYPAKMVGVGDNWVKDIQTTGANATNMTTIYTVKAINGPEVTVAAQSKILISNDAGQTNGTQTATLIIDSTDGMVKTMNLEQDMTGTLQGTEMTMKTKGALTSKRK